MRMSGRVRKPAHFDGTLLDARDRMLENRIVIDITLESRVLLVTVSSTQ